jgi:DNA repair exonuclease SbcCD ATPase subunit
MRAISLRAIAVLGLVVAAGTSAQAQDQSEEGRLRDALRRTTVDLRSAQDSQAALQTALDQAQRQRDQLQQQVTALTARLAQAPAAAAPVAPVAAPQPSPADEQLKAALDAARAQNDSLQAGLSHWQAAYQQAATLARQKDAESQQATTASQSAEQTLAICTTKNTRLTAVAEDILHLYRTQSFHSLLLSSYEPLLGLAQVRLDNVIQDNDDKIREQKYYPNEQPAAPTPLATQTGAKK